MACLKTGALIWFNEYHGHRHGDIHYVPRANVWVLVCSRFSSGHHDTFAPKHYDAVVLDTDKGITRQEAGMYATYVIHQDDVELNRDKMKEWLAYHPGLDLTKIKFMPVEVPQRQEA
jgi:hypothetical protein